MSTLEIHLVGGNLLTCSGSRQQCVVTMEAFSGPSLWVLVTTDGDGDVMVYKANVLYLKKVDHEP